MLDKVGEVLHVERRQRQPVGDAAGSDPRVVDWPRPTAQRRGSRQLTPHSGDALASRDHRFIRQPVLKHRAISRSPVSQPGPLSELTYGHKGDQWLPTDQARG
jgi:hypothetical protein